MSAIKLPDWGLVQASPDAGRESPYSRQTFRLGRHCYRRSLREVRLPCWVENDARAMAIGEAMFGAGRGYDNILCQRWKGHRAGVIINGEDHRANRARRLGPMTIDPNWPVPSATRLP